MPPKTFVFRGLSQYDFPAIYMLSGAYSSTIAIWHIEGWRNVKKPCKRMLNRGRKIAFSRIALILLVPLQTEMKGLELKEMTKNGNNNHAERGRN